MKKETIIQLHEKIKKVSPLVHNITNYVAMNITANALLAIGASPVMAHAQAEVSDIVSIASALVINIGTLSDDSISSMFLAAKTAKEQCKPFVLDPVGSGAASYRTKTCNALMKESSPSVIRGNASEIMSLCEYDIETKGVDSAVKSHRAIDAAKKLVQQSDATVVVSGEIDYVVSHNTISEIRNGDVLMRRVTGIGCTATALIGAFVAVEQHMHTASVAAMALMGIAGEIAATVAKAPGSFHTAFIDALYEINADDISSKISVNTHDY